MTQKYNGENNGWYNARNGTRTEVTNGYQEQCFYEKYGEIKLNAPLLHVPQTNKRHEIARNNNPV